jgi:hypothetical protein
MRNRVPDAMREETPPPDQTGRSPPEGASLTQGGTAGAFRNLARYQNGPQQINAPLSHSGGNRKPRHGDLKVAGLLGVWN